MVMTNLSRPKGLIKIVSHNILSGQMAVPFWRRPKVVAYGAAIVLFASIGVIRTVGKPSLSVTVIRTPGAPYTQMPDGRNGNVFIFQISNNTAVPIKLDIKPQDKNLELLCGQCQMIIGSHGDLRLPAVIAFEKQYSGHTEIFEEATTGQKFEIPLIGP
jgi:polyferredoxin